jgi:tRNA(Ile2)-agmatinylcytidine synthase
VNLEKIKINTLSLQDLRNAVCCGKRMKSAGRGQGYRCEKCGSTRKDKVVEIIPRKISTGFYEVPPSARRHLAKPLVRYHMTAEASSYVH